jgi:signal-transduction protein with cAMP-binding, CBS, and nucleotidyltransferase domain
MFLDQKIPDECKALWEECRQLVPRFLDKAQPRSTDHTITTDSTLPPDENLIYLIKDGILNEYFQDQLVLSYEEGDVAGADSLLQAKTTVYRADFAIRVDTYDKGEIMQHILADVDRTRAWMRYTSCLSQSFHILMSHFNRQETSFHPELREYAEGEVIIHQGASDSEVFTLLSGSAWAMVGDTKVGEINTDEIFGAIAALTGTPRTASIIAQSDCTALVVQADRFRNLIAVRPDTVTKLVEDMARTIVSCNEKIVDLSKLKKY